MYVTHDHLVVACLLNAIYELRIRSIITSALMNPVRESETNGLCLPHLTAVLF